MKLTITLGYDSKNNLYTEDLNELENILITGQTGSGKSVFNHHIICSLLQEYTPDELQLFMADPKRVELTIYNGVPHLIDKVHMESEDILKGLEKIVDEQISRISKLKNADSKDIDEYNSRFPDSKIPYLIITIDTFSDIAFYNFERFVKVIKVLTTDSPITGIHTIMCDSRPSHDLFTDDIKNCFSTKISFATTSGDDSKVILGHKGAEKLLGRGDMLFLPAYTNKPIHLQGVNITDNDIEKVLKKYVG